MTYAVPSMEAAYGNLRPLFFGAFGRLARQGFVAAPTDTVDLIHDFFAEAWTGVAKNYDPHKGPFEKYAYVAFVHFVRPRIVGTIQTRNSFLEYEQVMNEVDERLNIEPDFEFGPDVQRLREAIDRLPDVEHHVLRDYLSFESPSERALAKRFGLSRYKLRAALISALGSVIVCFDRPQSISTRDWNVALGVWRDRRSFAGVAKSVGITVHQAKAANLRMLKYLSQVLSKYQARDHSELRSYDMSTKLTIDSVESLFTEALQSSGNLELLERVREQGDQIIAALESCDRFGPTDEQLSQIAPEWLATVYDALSGVEPSGEVEEEFYASAGAEESVGIAFRETLMAGISEKLQRFETGFESLPSVEYAEEAELLNTPSAKGAGLFSRPLARVGLNPLSIFYATEAVSYLIERLEEQDLLSEDATILLEETDVTVDREQHDILTWELLVDEIRRLAVCRTETAAEIYKWLVQVAQIKPYLFSGFKCEPAEWGLGVRLTSSEIRFDNLYQRWGLSLEQVQAVMEQAVASV